MSAPAKAHMQAAERSPETAGPATTPVSELTVVIPTRNERDNVLPVYESLCSALRDIDWEAIFVDDDSQDDTSEAIHRLACRDRRVRCIRRIGAAHH